jgi:HEAT repeat protein
MNRSRPNVDPNSLSPDDRGVALNQLVAVADDSAVAVLGQALLGSHWPVCDDLANALARIGTEPAKAALLKGLKARRHHIRSAAVKALATIGGPDARTDIQSLANDPSYEVRQDVAEALRQRGV